MEEKEKMSELDAQLRLAQIMNDSPIEITVGGEKRYITALKPAVATMIAEESAKIQKAQSGNMVDIMKQYAICLPSVIKCLTLAILNDKDRIYSDYRKRELSEEYYTIYEQIEWESRHEEWLGVLLEVLNLLNFDFFFHTTAVIDNFRQMILTKKIHAQ